MNWDEKELDRELLESWREATEVPDAAVSQLRASVLSSIAQPRPRFPWWKWAVPLALAGVLAVVVVTRPDAPSEVSPVPVKQVAAPIAPIPLLGEEPVPVRQQPIAPRQVTRRQKKSVVQEAAYIRYETPDPDVVILLIGADGSGE